MDGNNGNNNPLIGDDSSETGGGFCSVDSRRLRLWQTTTTTSTKFNCGGREVSPIIALRRALGGVLLFCVLSGLLSYPPLLSNPASIHGRQDGARDPEELHQGTPGVSNHSILEYAVDSKHGGGNDDDENDTPGLVRPGRPNVAASGSRISYRLVRNRPYSHVYNEYKCFSHQRDLPRELKGHGVVDFYPDVTATNHTTLVLGDSIAIQIAQSMEVAWGVLPENRLIDVLKPLTRIVSWPVRGGGALVQYRYPFLMDRRYSTDPKRRRLAPWLWNRTRMQQTLELLPIPTTTPQGGVDVVIQRITHPWITFESITHESLKENTELVSEVFQMPTLIYVNMIFNNNILTQEHYEQLVEKRELVRDFARSWYAPPANGTLRRIMVLDMDVFSDQLNECNGRSLGFNTSAPYEEWMLSHVREPFTRRYAWHVAHVCAERVPDQAPRCRQNLISNDGLHVCPSTVNGRVTAGLACLTACAERDDDEPGRGEPLNDQGRQPRFDLRKCERHCNRKFMSLAPIPPSEMFEFSVSYKDFVDAKENAT